MNLGLTRRSGTYESCLLIAAAVVWFIPANLTAQVVTGPSAASSHAPVALAPVGPSPTFDVASIRHANRDAPNRTSEHRSGDTWKLNYSNTPLFYCLQKAYGVKDYQISGPEWIKTASYDIIAVGPYKQGEEQGWQTMLQNLLTDRFKLKVHYGTRMLPTYALVMSKKGQKFREAKPGGRYDISGHKGRDTFEGASMADLARNLTRITGLPVFDKTGLTGRYDFELQYSMESESGVPDSGAPDSADAAPSIFSAIQEQLGLKLEARKGPAEVVVVDHVEQPSAN